MITLLALLIVGVCVAASLRRLYFVFAATSLDPSILLTSLRGDAGRARLAEVARCVRSLPTGEWVRSLFDALGHRGNARVAAINEQLTEIDYRLQRWSRVPRVCASACTAAGFLFAAIALLWDPDRFVEEVRSGSPGPLLTSAFNAAALGIAGTSFCFAVHVRARRASRARAETTDKLVDRLESMADALPPPAEIT